MIIDSIEVLGLNCNSCQETYEYVDLGLPSGTLWATKNLQDANGNELYFAWGETQGYTSGQVGTDKNFSWGDDDCPNDYAFGPYDRSDEINHGMTKYNKVDGKTELEPEDDAVIVNLGPDWRMPTKAEFEELLEYTDITIYGEGESISCLLTSKINGNRLFLPLTGGATNGVFFKYLPEIGICGVYWSSSLNEENVSGADVLLCLGVNAFLLPGSIRHIGVSIRPVRSNS